jgi:hypothetical protein
MKAAGVKALRLLFVFAVSVPERVVATALTTESAALPVVKSIGLFGLFFESMFLSPFVGPSKNFEMVNGPMIRLHYLIIL